MNKITQLSGIVAPLDALNVDTDQIIPKQFLKRIERTGYGQYLFYDWRFKEDGVTPDPSFEMNAARYQGASILLAKDNFGCGSSREHAPWSLADYGFTVIIAPSFADIFFNNCINNSIVPIVLSESAVEKLFGEVRATEGYELRIDLPAQTLTTPSGETLSFELDDFLRERLINGWDQIGLTLRHEERITAYEKAHGL